MQIHHGFESFPIIDNAIVTSGTFDGVHLGHLKILHRLRKIAKSCGGQTVLITFWPHPRIVLQPGYKLKLLTSFEEKVMLLKEEGIDHLVVIPFTKAFSKLSSQEFVEDILIKSIQAKKLVIGYNHHFGRNREGSFQYLKSNAAKYGFEVEEITRHDVEFVGISSTKIRAALASGNVELVSSYLGRDYSINGKVKHGNRNGKRIGFPTANIDVTDLLKLIPVDGVYAVKVIYEGQVFGGMLNIGHRPTIEDDARTIEVHIIGFDKNIYDRNLQIQFIDRIRNEIKFENLDALKDQLKKDKELVLEILSARQ